MQKIILVTGATDGIGFETAKQLVEQGHHVIIHGRNPVKAESVKNQLSPINSQAKVDTLIADLSSKSAVEQMIVETKQRFAHLDVLINNAGVFANNNPMTDDGLDIRFMVNTIAPYRLTTALLPLFDTNGRIVNLSSAAQSPVNSAALAGKHPLGDNAAYAQSKLALTMWTTQLGLAYKQTGPMMVSVNPKSLLGSKMVKQAYGIHGSDLSIGADILVRAALSDEFATAHGKYYDNDIQAFAPPHPDAIQPQKNQQLVDLIEQLLA
ncbi:SDR family NAD(P)-dependent oxidoreductase [Shewanella intestini]|uniref:SDR family NAD(P)-dependent oxidoreductase n=1 Tax=Shewanella intestini TaxID=2017544 RepID=A0ABS5I1D6_9GAMM|nr:MULTISPECIES: SDR family NAD(P)-dependent oxidoreductase [Shewanella]MBR9727499.1 SDR family NAD(P)-dependent oxidoreductase [Shewanella intestini]MRG35351.1 SDR family NAD(P)-dependent oxidoreductase [Shewanella sp. XMDDZSB0408]